MPFPAAGSLCWCSSLNVKLFVVRCNLAPKDLSEIDYENSVRGFFFFCHGVFLMPPAPKDRE